VELEDMSGSITPLSEVDDVADILPLSTVGSAQTEALAAAPSASSSRVKPANEKKPLMQSSNAISDDTAVVSLNDTVF
jgi:hypothetical protein